jgi:hypothetical protein
MFSIFVAGYAYVVRRYDLSNAWLLIGVTVMDSFYEVVFDPSGFGWDAASAFGGGVIAFGVIMIFDSSLWPDPAEVTLMQSIASEAGRIRERLDIAVRGYLDPWSRSQIPRAPAISELPAHLTLLTRTAREGASPRRRSRMLAITTVNERLHMEVARLLSIAREEVPSNSRMLFRSEIERVVTALDASI